MTQHIIVSMVPLCPRPTEGRSKGSRALACTKQLRHHCCDMQDTAYNNDRSWLASWVTDVDNIVVTQKRNESGAASPIIHPCYQAKYRMRQPATVVYCTSVNAVFPPSMIITRMNGQSTNTTNYPSHHKCRTTSFLPTNMHKKEDRSLRRPIYTYQR